MTQVERQIASDRDLAELSDDVVAAVIEEAANATREADVHPTTPYTATVTVEAEIVDEESEGDVEVITGP